MNQLLSTQSSHELSFERLYKSHYRAVRTVVSRFRFGDATADDLVQDIFMQAWQNLASLKDQAAFSGWLMTIARNRCLNEVRKTKPTVSVSGTDALGAEDSTEHELILIADDNFASLHFEHSLSLLRELIAMHEGEPRATVAKMFYLEEKPVKEICDALGMNQNTVLSHLRRFRLIVGQALTEVVAEKGSVFQ